MKTLKTLSLLLVATPAFAGVIHDESIDGDISTDPLNPTPVTVTLGSNTLSGTVAATADIRDYITFNIPAGQELTGIFLLEWTDVNSGGNGNRGFTHIDDGTSSVVPSAETSGDFLGGSHLDRVKFPNTTDNALLTLAGAPQGGVGFVAPLGPGDYTLNIQQTGLPLTAYEVDLQLAVAPPPACEGDLDGDNDTDVLDFGIFAGNFGQAVPPNTGGDFDGDGFVTVLDFATFAADFGCTP